MPLRSPTYLRNLAKRRDLLIGVPALILLLVGLTAYIFYPNWRAAQHWRQAEQAIEARDFAEAGKHLQKYVAAHPGRAEGHFVLARTLRRAGRFGEANRALGQARRLDWVPELIALEELLAQVQQGTGGERDLERLAAYVRAGHPDELLILEALVQGHRAVLQFDQAGKWLDHWVERFPQDWLGRLWRAEHAQAFGHFDRARDEYLKALELRPDHDETHLRLGLLALANRAQAAEAETHLRKYLKRHPQHVEARIGLARSRRDQGDFDGAAAVIKEVLDADPGRADAGHAEAGHAEAGYAEAALLAGAVEAERGNNEDALAWLRRAEKGGADPQATQFQLARVLKRFGKTSEAEAHQRRFEALEKTKQALDKAVLAMLEEPTNAARHHDVGRLFTEMGQGAKAERYFQAALRIDPAHGPSHQALFEYYARVNRLDLAERHRAAGRGK